MENKIKHWGRPLGFKCSKETRKKTSDALKDVPKSEAHKKAIGEGNKRAYQRYLGEKKAREEGGEKNEKGE